MDAQAQALEAKRLALQLALDAQKSPRERNRLGQFATPPELARDILVHSLSLSPRDAPIRFLDPALGTGSFFSALLHLVPSDRIEPAQGFEIDPEFAVAARTLWKDTPLSVTVGDFTKLAPPNSESERYNLLICNPPYVRHQHIEADEKTRLQNATKETFGIRIDGLAGLYCHFLAAAHSWMRRDAIASWLVPSEFMDVKYGRAVKHYLLHRVVLLRVHRFDPNNVQFDNALVSSAVLFFSNTVPTAEHLVEFTYGGTLKHPVSSRLVSTQELRNELKWTHFPVSDSRDTTPYPKLGDFFHIKRGIATGGNGFFILRREEIERLGLPWDFFRPILPSPRHLHCEEVMADEKGKPALEKSLFLLDCRLPEDEVKERYPVLWRYLQTGKPGVSGRYLCSKRDPWYRQEDRTPAPFLCSYIGRSDGQKGKPFRFILNHSGAIAANSYLLLYPKPSLARAIAVDDTLLRQVWQLLGAIQSGDLLNEGRVYGGGLHKLEPKELAMVRVNGLQELLSSRGSETLVQRSLFESTNPPAS